MTVDVAVLVPPAPASALGAYAAAALFTERGRPVTLLEPVGAEPGDPEEPFLLPLPQDGRGDSAGGLVSLLATATRLGPLDRLLERPAVACQVLLPRHRLDLAADPGAFALEVAREWPEAQAGFAALDRALAELDDTLAAAPPRLLLGSPTRLGRAGDLVAFLRRPVPWLRGRRALGAPPPGVDGEEPCAALAALAEGLGGDTGSLGHLWRAWAAARRGGIPRRSGGGGLVGHLRSRALGGGAAREPYDPEGLAVTSAPEGLAVRTGPGAGLSARVVVSGYPTAGLAPRAEGRTAERLARLAAAAAPRRWAARLTVTTPRAVLPAGLGRRAILAGEGGDGPLLLEVDPLEGTGARLRLTALLGHPAVPADLEARLRGRLEWLVPFLPAEAAATVQGPDPRSPVRFAASGARPVALPPLAGRHLALVGPDVAPALGPEGEVLAALAVVGALNPGRA